MLYRVQQCAPCVTNSILNNATNVALSILPSFNSIKMNKTNYNSHPFKGLSIVSLYSEMKNKLEVTFFFGNFRAIESVFTMLR